jgi:hypothetical protein
MDPEIDDRPPDFPDDADVPDDAADRGERAWRNPDQKEYDAAGRGEHIPPLPEQDDVATPSRSSEIDPSLTLVGIMFTLLVTGIIVGGIAYHIFKTSGRDRERRNPDEKIPFKFPLDQNSPTAVPRWGSNQI